MRTTIYLDESVNARLRQFVPRRGLNRFINQVLAEKLAALEREQLEQAMKEGYLATRSERDDVSKDWAVVETEDWPA